MYGICGPAPVWKPVSERHRGVPRSHAAPSARHRAISHITHIMRSGDHSKRMMNYSATRKCVSLCNEYRDQRMRGECMLNVHVHLIIIMPYNVNYDIMSYHVISRCTVCCKLVWLLQTLREGGRRGEKQGVCNSSRPRQVLALEPLNP